jgi:hypothetical protein
VAEGVGVDSNATGNRNCDRADEAPAEEGEEMTTPKKSKGRSLPPVPPGPHLFHGSDNEVEVLKTIVIAFKFLDITGQGRILNYLNMRYDAHRDADEEG